VPFSLERLYETEDPGLVAFGWAVVREAGRIYKKAVE